MTNEEAIRLVDDRMCYGREKWNRHHQPVIDEYWQAGEMAIKALEAEPHWIPVTEDTPDEERECWIAPKTTSKVYRGIFTRHYGRCHRTGFICDEGFMWLNTALAWMYCEVPEPYKGVTE